MPNRKNLLPPYLEDGPAWEQLVEAIDEVFKPRIDDPTLWLAKLRDTWILKAGTEAQLDIESGLINNADFELPDKELLIRQANMLGFDLKESDLMTDTDYQRMVRNLSKYWYSKGKPDFISFFGFVLDSVLTIKQLWSTTGPTWDEYGPLVPEGDPSIGTPVWQGGTWFPTTHVIVGFDPFKFEAVSVPKLRNLFYSIANYNLVLEAIESDGALFIHSVDETEIARIVVATLLVEENHTITTTNGVLVPPPPPPPSPSFIATDNVAGSTGTLISGATTNDNLPEFSGSGQTPGDLITLFVGATPVGTGTVAGDGTWSVVPTSALTDGSNSLSLTVTNAALVSSAHTATFTLVIDTSAPSAPSGFIGTDDVGPFLGSIVSGSTINDNIPVFSGSGLTPGFVITLFDGVTTLGTATVTGGGTWSFTPSSALAEGSHSITATLTDLAGNTSVATAALTFTVDTITPVIPPSIAQVNFDTTVFDERGHTVSGVLPPITADGTNTMGHSGAFDRSMYVHLAPSADYDAGSQDFCIETTFKMEDLGNPGYQFTRMSLFGLADSGGFTLFGALMSPSTPVFGSWQIGFGIVMWTGAVAQNYGVTAVVSTADIGVEHHVACVREGSNLKMYLDGVLTETTPIVPGSIMAYSGQYLGINFALNKLGVGVMGDYVNTGGGGSNTTFQGRLSGFRYTQGSPVYTAPFTRPTNPLPV